MLKRKKSAYVYKLVSKVRKHPELLLDKKYGFNYFEDEKQEVKIFAKPITLKEDNPLFIQCVRFFEHCYETATSEERKKDFEGYEFKLELQENQQNAWRLVLTDELKKEFSEAQLCVTVDKKIEDATYLFINSPIQNAYYHAKTLDECAGETIKLLLDNKLIYKKKRFYNAN